MFDKRNFKVDNLFTGVAGYKTDVKAQKKTEK